MQMAKRTATWRANRYDPMIEDYRAFTYNNLFGAQQRCGSFFQPPQ